MAFYEIFLIFSPSCLKRAKTVNFRGIFVIFTKGKFKNQKDPGGSFPNSPFLARMRPVYTVALTVCLGMRL